MERKHIDFEAARAIPIRDVVARYGVQLKWNGNKATAKCPLPTHSSKDSTHSFSIKNDGNYFQCFSSSCNQGMGKKGGDCINFVAAMENLSRYDAAAKILEMNGAPVKVEAAIVPATGNKPLGFRLKDVNATHPMIQGKGISIETAKHYGIGWFPGSGSMRGRIVFELWENGEMIGYSGRLVEGDGSKWLLPKNFVKSFVYGLHLCDPKYPLVLGESFWLPPFLHEKGMQGGALMGAEMTEAQEDCLRPFKVIWLAMDNDEAGREKAVSLRQRLMKDHAVKVTYLKE
jgi:DNA primase